MIRPFHLEEKMAKVNVQNTRPTFLTAPNVAGFPELRLIPGANPVEEEHLAALEALKHSEEKAIKGGAAKVWEDWKKLGWVVVPTPKEVKEQAGKPIKPGPKPPESLMDRTPEASLAMVATEKDTDTLRQWLSTEERPDVREALEARLK